MSRYWVGLTGGLASGKSTAAEHFRALDIVVVDADTLAAELTADGGAALPSLRAALGDWAFTEDGALDRAAVRRRVFTDENDYRRLEAVLHPMIRRQLKRRLQEAPSAYAVGVIPLLFERQGWREYFHRIATIDCEAAEQKRRAHRRDSEADASLILNRQWTSRDRRAFADDVIDNNGKKDALAATIAALHERYLARAKDFNDEDRHGQKTQ